MKMEDALAIIDNKGFKKLYMVHFEWIKGSILEGDYFPDKHDGEKLIDSEEEAWDMAIKFADATKGKTCNLYVVNSNFTPVFGYREKIILNRTMG